MEIKITNEVCNYYRISKDFTIEFEVVAEHVIELEFNKWQVESDYETDNGCDFTEESQKIYDSLTEEQQTEIDDFILDIKL